MVYENFGNCCNCLRSFASVSTLSLQLSLITSFSCSELTRSANISDRSLMGLFFTKITVEISTYNTTLPPKFSVAPTRQYNVLNVSGEKEHCEKFKTWTSPKLNQLENKIMSTTSTKDISLRQTQIDSAPRGAGSTDLPSLKESSHCSQ
jgi:hypothetical protein